MISDSIYLGLEYCANVRGFMSVKIFSKIYGDPQEHLIIIHGLFGMCDNWNTLGNCGTEYYTVHLVDLRIMVVLQIQMSLIMI